MNTNDLRDWGVFVLAIATLIVAITGFLALWVKKNGK